MGGAGAKTLSKGAGAYAKTNDEQNRDKTETPSLTVEGVPIGNSITLSGGTKVIKRNVSSTLIKYKKQPTGEACTVAGDNKVIAEGSSMGGVFLDKLANGGCTSTLIQHQNKRVRYDERLKKWSGPFRSPFDDNLIHKYTLCDMERHYTADDFYNQRVCVPITPKFEEKEKQILLKI